MRNSEEKNRAIIEQSRDGIVITDESGNITTWNGSFAAMTGVGEDEALGKPLWQMQWKLTPRGLPPAPAAKPISPCSCPGPIFAGWKIRTVGDNIAWMKPGADGRLHAINSRRAILALRPEPMPGPIPTP